MLGAGVAQQRPGLRRGWRPAVGHVALAASLLLALIAAGVLGAADPLPPGDAALHHIAGRALWQLGEDGGLKLAGASPPVAPRPKFWTFTQPCRAGQCSGLCWEKTRWYDAGRCLDNSSGRRYCKCWRAADAAGAPAPPPAS